MLKILVHPFTHLLPPPAQTGGASAEHRLQLAIAAPTALQVGEGIAAPPCRRWSCRASQTLKEVHRPTLAMHPRTTAQAQRRLG